MTNGDAVIANGGNVEKIFPEMAKLRGLIDYSFWHEWWNESYERKEAQYGEGTATEEK